MNLRWLTTAICYFFQGLFFKAAWRQYQKKGVLAYLKALQALRRGVAGSILVFIFLQTLVIGLIGVSVVTVFLVTEDHRTRLWILLGAFSLLLIVPAFGIGFLMSERTWFRLSGAEQLVERINKPNL